MDKPANAFVERLQSLPPRGKAPNSCRTLDSWIAMAEQAAGLSGGGRMGWLVASTVIAAKLQQVVDDAGRSRFMLKGGTLLLYRLGVSARATKDLDGVVRGDLQSFIESLDRCLLDPWGPLAFSRSSIEQIDTVEKIVKPLRFDIFLSIAGKTWRKVQIEISADEGRFGTPFESVEPLSLAFFGLPTPDRLVGISMAYQFAEKLHALSAPHCPPDSPNDRARDVVDLVLIGRLSSSTGAPSVEDLSLAVDDIFSSRMNEALALGREPRKIPERIDALEHWDNDYKRAAESSGLDQSLVDAIGEVNSLLASINEHLR